MTMATTTREAANLSFKQINIKGGGQFAGAAISTALGTFITLTKVQLPFSVAVNRVVGNWLIPLSAIHANLATGPNSTLPLSDFDAIVDGVSKMMYSIGASGVSGAQSTALLVAWNTAFGT